MTKLQKALKEASLIGRAMFNHIPKRSDHYNTWGLDRMDATTRLKRKHKFPKGKLK